MSTARAPLRQRLFVALWPPSAVAQRLRELTDELHVACGGRAVPCKNQHVTVAFLGNVDASRIEEVRQVMRACAGEGFELHLDKVVFRKRGGMWWARATQVPEPLVRLVDDLRLALGALDFALDARAFVPHITLLRDARASACLPRVSGFAWRVDELTLVRSHLDRNGARYEIIFRAPLLG